jgi:hypothetical protein
MLEAPNPPCVNVRRFTLRAAGASSRGARRRFRVTTRGDTATYTTATRSGPPSASPSAELMVEQPEVGLTASESRWNLRACLRATGQPVELAPNGGARHRDAETIRSHRTRGTTPSRSGIADRCRQALAPSAIRPPRAAPTVVSADHAHGAIPRLGPSRGGDECLRNVHRATLVTPPSAARTCSVREHPDGSA